MQILFLRQLPEKDVITWAGLSCVLCKIVMNARCALYAEGSHTCFVPAPVLVIDQVDSYGRGMTMITPFNPLNTKQLQALWQYGLDVQWNIHRPPQPHGWPFVFSFSLITPRCRVAVLAARIETVLFINGK